MAALGGAICLAVLFPRLDPSKSAPLLVDRNHAVERVRELASRYGVDTAGWRALVNDDTDQKIQAYLAEYPGDPAAKLFDGLRVAVTLIDADKKHSVRVVLFGDGRPAEWKLYQPPTEPRSGPAPETVLTDFVGSSPGKIAADGVNEEGASRYTWDWKAADRFPLRATLKMEQKAGALLSVTLSPEYGEQFDGQYKRTRSSLFGSVASWVGGLTWTLGLGLCLWQMVRGRMPWRSALVLLGAHLVWTAISFWGGTHYQDFLGRRESALDALLSGSDQSSSGFWAFFWLPVFAGAGYAMRSAGNREKWHSLTEALGGRILNRTVAESLAIGMLGGIGMAAVPYLVAAIRWLPGNVLDFRSMDALVAPSPAIVALRLSAAVPALALFGFLFPFTRYLRKPLAFWAVFAPLSLLVLVNSMPFHSAAPALVTAALLLPAYLLLYLRCDLLAVLAAAVAARAAIVPCLLLSQPLSSVRVSALGIMSVGAVAIAASVYWALRGPEEDRSETSADFADLDVPAKSDRVRLQAEFEVARKAQQDALPDDPPAVNGYTLAGWCEPAQQVGGDLYDYLPAARRPPGGRRGRRFRQGRSGGVVHDGDEGAADGCH